MCCVFPGNVLSNNSVHMCIHVCMCIHVHVQAVLHADVHAGEGTCAHEGHMSTLDVFLHHCPLYMSKTGLLTKPGAH